MSVLEKGTTVAGYRIERLIGRGGMGTVYAAMQQSLKRPVALKILSSHLSDDAEFRARFRREGQVQATLHHSNIVAIYDTGESDVGLFIAMQLVRGVNLKDLIVARELDTPRTMRILGQVADALDTAHGAGLVHRDVKPQNILIAAHDQAFLADFGLSKATEDMGLTKSGQVLGTLDYISPEQIRDGKVTAATDTYALTAILYECLAGVVPFPRENDTARMYAHLHELPASIGAYRPEFPTALDDVLGRGMAKNARDRPRSAVDLVRDAGRAISGNGQDTQAGSRSRSPGAGAMRSAVTQVARDRRGTTFLPVDHSRTSSPARAANTHRASRATRRGDNHEPHQRRAIVRITAAGAFIVILAAIGLLIGQGMGGNKAATSRTAQHGPFTVDFPRNWRRIAIGVAPRLGITGAFSLAPWGSAESGGLMIGMTQAAEPTLVSATLAAKLTHAPRARSLVQVGDVEGYRYTNLELADTGRKLTLYVIPSDKGVATAACFGSVRSPRTIPARCEAVVGTLTLDGVKPIGFGPSVEYATRLDEIIGTLNASRAVERIRLATVSSPENQAAAAYSIAQAYAVAVGSVVDLEPPPSVRVNKRKIVGALRALATNYNRLGGDARAGTAATFKAHSSDIGRAERQLQARLRDLQKIGYAVR